MHKTINIKVGELQQPRTTSGFTTASQGQESRLKIRGEKNHLIFFSLKLSSVGESLPVTVSDSRSWLARVNCSVIFCFCSSSTLKCDALCVQKCFPKIVRRLLIGLILFNIDFLSCHTSLVISPLIFSTCRLSTQDGFFFLHYSL